MRILFFCNDWSYFRAHRLALAERMRDAGHEIAVMTGGIVEERPPDPIDGMSVHPITLDRHRLSVADFKAARAFARLVRQFRPDVIHALTIKPNLIAALAQPFTVAGGSVRTVLTFPGLGRVFEPTGVAGRLRRWIVSRALGLGVRRTDSFCTFENDDDRETMARAGVVNPERAVTVMGAGIDRDRFHPPAARPAGAPVTFLFASRLLASKGVLDFLNAARILKRGGVDARFLIAGPSDPGYPDGVDVARLLAEQPIDGARFLGAVAPEDMPDLLRDVDVVCLPSRLAEGFPRSLIEAAACGCALVGTDQPAIRQIVRDGETGWLVPAGSVDALAAAMSKAAMDPDLARMLGCNAAAYCARLPVGDADVFAEFLRLYRGDASGSKAQT